MQKRTIIHKYSVVPLLAIAAMHAAVWLGTKSLADFSRAFDVTLGLDALIPLRPEWVVVYVGTFVFWGMGLLLIARQDEELCCRFASGVIIADIICGVIFLALPSCIARPELSADAGLYMGAVGRVLVRHADKLLPVDALPVCLPRVPSVAAHAGRKNMVQGLLRRLRRTHLPVNAVCQAARHRRRYRRHILRRAGVCSGTKTACLENIY